MPRASLLTVLIGPLLLMNGISAPIEAQQGTSAPGMVDLRSTEIRPAPDPIETEVLLAYDESNLYVAFIARDPDPGPDLRPGGAAVHRRLRRGIVQYPRGVRPVRPRRAYLECQRPLSGGVPTYRSDAGLWTRHDFRRATGWTGVAFYPNRPFLEWLSGSLFGGSYWNFASVRTQDIFGPGASVTLPRQTTVGLNTTLRREVSRGVDLTGIREYPVFVNSNFSAALRGSASSGTGRPVARTLAVPEVGEGWNASASATIQPWQRMVIQPSVSYQELSRLGGEEVFSGLIARTRFSFQYNRELNLRLVLQYNDFSRRLDHEPLLMYQIHPFSILYVGSTHGSIHSSQVKTG